MQIVRKILSLHLVNFLLGDDCLQYKRRVAIGS